MKIPGIAPGSGPKARFAGSLLVSGLDLLGDGGIEGDRMNPA